MATRDQVVASVQNLLGTDAHLSATEIASLVQLRYDHVVDLSWWSRRRRDFHLTTTAMAVSTEADEVTVTQGSATVTSAGTPFTAGMDGAYITIGGVYQPFVVSFTSTSVVELEDGEGNTLPWPADTDTEASWRVFRTLIPLPAGAQDVVSLAGQSPLEEFDGGRPALDAHDPYRLTTDSEPYTYVYAGETAAGVRLIEVWPVPTTAVTLRGQYIKATATLLADSLIDVPSQILVWGVAADACGLLYAKEGAEPWSRLQTFYEGKYQVAFDNAERKDRDRRSLALTAKTRLTHGGFTDWDITHLTESP